MARVKGGTVSRARRKKVLKLAKGYFGSKHTLYKNKQNITQSGEYVTLLSSPWLHSSSLRGPQQSLIGTHSGI